MTAETRLSRTVSMSLAVMIAVTNIAALGVLVAQLVKNKDADGGALLLAALQVWATRGAARGSNVIAFALIFWELDRGGPVARTQADREDLPLADFRFTHDEDDDTVVEVARGSSKTGTGYPRSSIISICRPPIPARSARPTPYR
jgi:hypothetical protein